MAAVTPLLVTKGLGRSFGGLKAVDGVDFSLAAGEIRAIIGPNGAGKTSFVGLISGRIQPSSGAVFFEGRDITSLPAYRRVRLGIAYTFQITSVLARLPVYDNVALAVQRTLTSEGRLSGATLARDTMEALGRVGLADRAGAIAGTLAYGHQRLLEIAMGLALKPKLLILDEPTQGLSDGEIDTFAGLVEALSVSATILLIEHNVPLVMRLARRITVFERGRILAEGTPDEIRASKAVQDAYLGSGADA